MEIILPSEILNMIKKDGVTDILYSEEGGLFAVHNGEKKRVRISMGFANSVQIFLSKLSTADDFEFNHRNPVLETSYSLDGKNIRVEATRKPISNGFTFSIRIPTDDNFPLLSYFDEKQIEEFKDCILNRGSVIIAGSTGSGKTSLMRSIFHEFYTDSDIRVFAVEDTTELNAINDYSVTLRSSKETNLQDLIRVALRSMPDQIVVGEIRGAEAYELMKAWNTGHNGITSLHANSLDSITERVNFMMNEGSNNPTDYTNYIESVVPLYIYIERKKNKIKVNFKHNEKN